MSDWITTKIPKDLAEKIDDARKGTSKSRSQFVYDVLAESLLKREGGSLTVDELLKEILENQTKLEETLKTILKEKGVTA